MLSSPDTALGSAIAVAFTGRRGGVSSGPFSEANVSTRVGDDPGAVLENRRRALERLGLAGRSLVTVRQVHGARILDVSAAALPSAPPEMRALPVAADGIVARGRDVVLMVGVADCAPVLLADADRRVIGALHVGWRGLLRGAVEAFAQAMRDAGARLDATVAHVGPAIGPCCLTVSEGLRGAVASRYPTAAARSRDGLPALDLRAGVIEALEESAIAEIETIGGCTLDDPAEYFSARRDGRTGSQAGMIALRVQ